MNFLNILGILAAGSIGVAAGGVLGSPFQSKVPTQENNQQSLSIPQLQVQEEKTKPILTFSDSLSKEQVDVLKDLWRRKDDSPKHLIDYFDYQGWVNKAKQYSLVKEKWPGDIIFIEDKSDKNLGEKLRDKCYSAAQWFFIGSRSENNVDVKSFMKNVDEGFSPSIVKDLCATDNDTSEDNIKSLRLTKSLSSEAYTCKNEATTDEQWIKDVYLVKKDGRSNDTMCQIIKDSVFMEIEYKDGTKKYQFLKSRKSPNDQDFEAIPGNGEIYSSFSEIPGLSDLFEFKK